MRFFVPSFSNPPIAWTFSCSGSSMNFAFYFIALFFRNFLNPLESHSPILISDPLFLSPPPIFPRPLDPGCLCETPRFLLGPVSPHATGVLYGKRHPLNSSCPYTFFPPLQVLSFPALWRSVSALSPSLASVFLKVPKKL